jgi:hypothetical protein
MTAGTPANSRATGSQMPPLMSQKVLKRAATFSEGSQPLQLANRRRSSLVSESSDARFAPPRPIDNDMEVLTSTKKPSVWYSSPLAFAILPAAAGLFFPNGTVLATDILLLALGSGFLNWCVKAPWYVYTGNYSLPFTEIWPGIGITLLGSNSFGTSSKETKATILAVHTGLFLQHRHPQGKIWGRIQDTTKAMPRPNAKQDS